MNKTFRLGFAAVLSVMMVLCFMPGMAFAANGSWSSDFKTVKADAKSGQKNVQFNADWTLDDATGLTKATPIAIPAKASDTEGESGQAAIEPVDGVEAFFYNFDSAALVYEKDGSFKALNGSKWTAAAADSILDAKGNVNTEKVLIQFKQVRKVDGKDKTFTANVKPGDFKGWTVKIAAEGYKKGAENAQTVTFKVTAKKGDTEVDLTEANPDLIGKIADATVTVKGQAKTVADAKFHFDSTNNAGVTSGKLVTDYDATEHTVVADEFDGYKASYEVYNDNTGKWVAVDSIKLTDVQANDIRVKATFKKSGAADVQRELNVNLVPADVSIILSKEKSVTKYDKEYWVSGSDYNKYDYVAIVADKKKDSIYKAKKAKNDELMAYFKANYDVEAEAADKNETDLVFLQIVKTKGQAYSGLNFDVNVVVEDSAILYLNKNKKINVYVDDTTVVEGKTPKFDYTVKADFGSGERVIENFKTKIVFTTVGGKELKGLKPGTYALAAKAKGYKVTLIGGDIEKEPTLTVVKKSAKAQKISVKTKTVKIKAGGNVLKKTKTVKAITKVNSKTKPVKYTLVRVNKMGSYFDVNEKNGKITIEDGVKTGLYKVKIKVSAPAKGNYKAASKVVYAKIKVVK